MADAVDPHPVDEDPEENIGDEIPDPWSDPEQADWPQNEDDDEEDEEDA